MPFSRYSLIRLSCWFRGSGRVGFIHTVLIHDEKSNRLRGWAAGVFCADLSFYFCWGKNCGVKKYGVFLFWFFAKNTDGGTSMVLCFLEFMRKIKSVRISFYFPVLAQHDVGQGRGICLWDKCRVFILI